MGAEKIFSISGQFFIKDIKKEKLLFKHNEEQEKSRYYDLKPLLKTYKGTIFFIYPIKSDIDILQSKHIEELSNIFQIKIKSEIHGDGLKPENYKYVFFMDSEKLKQKLDCKKEYSKQEIYNKTVPACIKVSKKIVHCCKFLLKPLLVKTGLFEKVKKLLK